MNEHVEIVNACGQLRRAVVDGGDVPEHARALALLLGPHTQSEEVGLFTVMKRRDEFADHVSILCGEHRSLDELLAAIAAGDHSLMDVFEDALRDHIDKEDNGLFPAAALGLDGDEWAEIDTTTHEHDHAAGTPHHH
ncbi:MULTISPECIES: hemerythrin domain-containing protein [unclassified Tessaracoccus]|nr:MULTISPECIES: hemerythrin domain-containing protein [unclassified Tessaracoccus]